MSNVNAASSDQFMLGDIEINRLGYGAMRIVGEGIGGHQKIVKAAWPPCDGCPNLG